jgi:TonB-dependent receptor
LDVAKDLSNSWLSNVSAGVNYADRSKNKQSPETGLSTLNGGFTQIDSKYLLPATNLGYAGAPSVLAWDVPSVLNAYYKPIVYGTPETLSYLVGKWWTVTEKVTTGFVKADLNHEISSSITLKGNVGVQVINTNQSSDAFLNDTANSRVVPFSDGKKYTDVLPAINLVFQLPDQQAVRVGIAKEMARPRMDQLKASTEGGAGIVSDPNTGLAVRQPSASAGNPKLDPWRADAFDLSFEKYFANKAYVSASAFYKNIKTYIYNATTQNHDFTSFVATLPQNYACTPAVCPPTTNFGPITGPQNGNGGKLKGLELTASLPGDLLAEGLKDFGTILSISQTESNITVKDTGGNNVLSGNNLGVIPLPGLSKTVWSATFYYEHDGFAARIATHARSKYIGEVTNFANDRAFKFVKGDQITDFQTSYEFGGRYQGLSVLFQVNNLTNAPYVAYQRSEAQLIDYQTYGRQYLLGVNYKL